MPHSFSPRPGLNLKAACRERDCTLQDLVNDALEVYLQAGDGGDQGAGADSKPTPKGRLAERDDSRKEISQGRVLTPKLVLSERGEHVRTEYYTPDGKLKYSELPTKPGEQKTYVLHTKY